jgi:DinB superfamily
MKKVLARLDAAHSQLLEAIAPLDAEKFAERPAPNQWSVAEVVHHLCLVEQRIIEGLERELRQPPQHLTLLYRLIPYSLIVGRRVRRVSAPKYVEPLNPPPKETVIENYNRTRAILKAIGCEHGRQRLNRVVLKHPFFGKLSGLKAFAFVRYHEQRHCKQIQEIIRRIG